MPIDKDQLLSLIGNRQPSYPTVAANTTSPSVPEAKVQEFKPDFELDDDGEEYMSVGVDGVLAASEKLLAMNRGLVKADERDSLRYQKIFRPNNLFRERIKMDSGKIGRSIMYQAAKRRNLSGLLPGAFDGYIDAVLRGNPLTSPLEEINPMQLKENSRRITKMGPGGIPSSDSITNEAQAVHASQFGFIDPIAGPECLADDDEHVTRIFTRNGWMRIKDITDDTELLCDIDGKAEFHKPEKVVHSHYEGPMHGNRNMNLQFLVTPNHRVYHSKSNTPNMAFTEVTKLLGKIRSIPCAPGVYEGTPKGTVQIGDREYSAKDWCRLLGWFISEGSVKGKQYAHPTIAITQLEDVHPEEYASIKSLCARMCIKFNETNSTPDWKRRRGYTKHIGVTITERGIQEYIAARWLNGCYDKWIPEEIFEWGVEERRALLDALLAGDGRVNKSHTTYCTVCKKLAEDVERLAIGLGYCTRLREEPDKREHVKTTNYCVALLKNKWRCTETNEKGRQKYWYTIPDYKGMVHCATVPGGRLYISVNDSPGYWTGNSERAGIDVRAAYGTKVGSNGRIYQKFLDRRTGKYKWMNASDIADLVVKIPD